MSLQYIWRLARRYRGLLVVGLILGLAAGWALTMAPASYQATSSILVRPRGEADLRLYSGTPERFARSQARIAGSDLVLDVAASSLGDSVTRDQLRAAVSVDGGTSDDVISVLVQADSEDAARSRAAAVVSAYEGITRAGTEILGTSVKDDSATMLRTLPLGAGLGLVGSMILILVLGAMRAPVLTPAQLSTAVPHQVFPLPVGVGGDRRVEAGRLQLMLQYLGRGSSADTVLVAGLDAPHMEARLTEALREVAPSARRTSIRALSDVQGDEGTAISALTITAVLCCVREGTPVSRVQDQLASLEVLSGSRLVVMGA